MGTIELALAVWEGFKPYALASCGGALIGLLIFTLARG